MVKIELNQRYQGRPSPAEMKRRWNLASQAMKEQDIDCLVMQANDGIFPQYVRWFAERRTIQPCVIMFDQNHNLSIITHGPLGSKVSTYGMEFANSISEPQVNVVFYGNNAVSDHAVGIIKKEGYKKIGILGLNILPAAFYINLTRSLPNNEIVDASDMIDQLIAVKSEEELAMLDGALKVHEAVANAIPAMVYAGRLEREFAADLCRLAIVLGADEHLSNIMICSQKIPGPMHQYHYMNKIIEEGDTLNVLFEVPDKTGYYADFHHYWGVGTPAPDSIKAMEISVEAHEYMAALCRPGAKASDVFVQMNEWKKNRGMDPELRMLGHGQGYGLTERPYFDANDPMILKENMYVALHPATQSGEASVAVARNYIITEDGAKRVSAYPMPLGVI